MESPENRCSWHGSPTPHDNDPVMLWYVAYGSNLHRDRFLCYLAGGRPAGAARTYTGCRDPRPPAADRPVLLPGGIYFAQTSPVWGGGVAFYDPSLPGLAPARAYLLTTGQFSDVLAQEMRRAPTATSTSHQPSPPAARPSARAATRPS